MLADQITATPVRRTPLLSFTARMVRGYDAARHLTEHLIPALEWAATTPDARLIVTMPPRHGKSLHVSESLPAWYLGNHPERRIIAASHTASLAYTFSRRVRNKLADPRWPFPGVAVADDKGAVQSWDTNRGGGYIAVGVGGSPTGHGGDLVLIDDPIRSAADADSQVIRDALWEWYQGTLRTRLEPGGSIVITATRWHEDDLTGRLLAAQERGGERWRHVHLPAIDETTGTALWPERWPRDALDAIRRSVGTRAWTAQYQGAPAPAEGGILKRPWFGTYATRPYEAAIIQSWDTAFQTGTAADYSVCTTLAFTPTHRYVLDVYRERLEFPDLERMVPRLYGQWRPDAVLIENKASGQSLLQSLRRTTDLPVIGVDVPNVRDWKIVRVNELAPMIEAGRLLLPEAAAWLDDALHELTAFPLAAHDDIVDSLMQGLAWIAARTDAATAWGGSWLPDDDDDRRWRR